MNLHSEQFEIQPFIVECQHSSSRAYEQFKRLLAALEAPESQQQALVFLNELVDYCADSKPQGVYFNLLNQQVLGANDEAVNLRLFQFPSTFLPEAWSFTFYEGLIRYPSTDYYQKSVTELGCGIGWISIALALRYGPSQMIGLDINPKAIVCARLNLFLNAFDTSGEAINLADGRRLVDILAFHESNLFSHLDEQPIAFDKIIGCIPQVLNPEPEVMEQLIAETASDEYLHSLSNYFAKQGYIEDQFGLGLIASAVEQSIPLLKSNGKLILNLGGRPGRSVLERLMQRRGFKVRRVWQTQVEQAADTEIDALVDIENTTGHRFEFYMSANSDTPIDASTALAYAQAGGKIYHSVDVYEAKLLFPEQVKNIFSSVALMTETSLQSAIDLTYDNYDDAEERYSFLSFLANKLEKISHFPYAATTGLDYFRQQLAEYFGYYLQIRFTADDILVTPGRRELIDSLLNNYQPELLLIEKSLSHLVDKSLLSDSSKLLYTPSKIEFVIELVQQLKPRMLVTRFDEHEVQSSHLIAKLIDVVCEVNCLLVIDLTDHINLSSQPDVHGVYRYLSNNGLPQNVILTAALINNRVYQNYSLNFALLNNPEMMANLSNAAELTYSRTPFLKQLYYGHLLEELLYFQRTRASALASIESPYGKFGAALSREAQTAFSHPAIVGNHLPFNEETIRMDYGENELPTPDCLKEFLFESYLVRKWVGDEVSADAPIRRMLAKRFNLPKNLYSKIVYGNGVAPIYSALLKLCAKDGGKLVVPTGSYGYFKAAAEYERINFIELQTSAENQFKITPAQLKETLKANPGSWLLLNAPVVNPTGVIYQQAELSELIAIATEYDATVIIDCIFSGLEFKQSSSWDLASNIQAISQSQKARLVLMGGISKEFSAGGLRFGYSWSTSKALLVALAKELPHKPHFTMGYAVRKLMLALLNEDKGLISHLSQQRKELAQRADKLTSVLTSQGWQVIQPEGGLFLVAQPAGFIAQNAIDFNDDKALTKAGDQVAEFVFERANVVINNSTWTGLPGYCRFVLSCSSEAFEEGLKRLQSLNLSNLN